MTFRSGFIAIIGRPNVGKSTLLNALLGEKVAIVSEKPQTTRNSIRGVWNTTGAQLVFIDTPGIHRPDRPLNEFMVREAVRAIRDVDVVLWLVEATGDTADEGVVIEELKGLRAPVVLAINKVDKVARERLLPLIDQYSKLYDFKEIIPISALRRDGLDVLASELVEMVPEGPRYFPEDMVTDQPERFMVAEIIREKVFRLTSQEIPYSVAVVCEEFNEDEKKGLIKIRAVINVERGSQKGIVIGKKGSMLKRIGTSAREEIEGLLGVKVFLELFVRVTEKWTRKPGLLKEFGYK